MAFCLSFCKEIRHLTADDLKRECGVKLFQILNSERKKKIKLKDKEVVYVFKKAMRNLLTDIWRNNRRAILVSLQTVETDEENNPLNYLIDDSPSAHDGLLYLQFIDLIRSTLSTEIEHEFFNLIVGLNDVETCDVELINLVIQEQENKLQRRKNGEFVIVNDTIIVQKKHLAQRLSVSPATVSRLIANLREKAERVLDL
jgi:hypothetical protein